MRICLVNHEYPPFPGGGIATYAEAAALELAAAGHEVHVVTNRAMYASQSFEHSLELWRDGRLFVHRLDLFDEEKMPAEDTRFLELDLRQFDAPWDLWSFTASNVAAMKVANYVEGLHASQALDVVEVPEYFAEGFYMLRRRRAGRVAQLPPVSVICHVSSRQLLRVSRLVNELGRQRQRELMLREDYCVQNADSLQTPSRSLMARYEAQFGEALPELREIIPYYLRLDTETGSLPPQLEGKEYLCAVGRIEPRKGSDVLLRAWAEIADEFPELHVAYLGREAWREGESFEEILRETVPEKHRSRVLRLGNVARGQVLAAVENAKAFVHAAPWDNYPSAALEALGLGAVCVMSDSGGHFEMVEEGKSGLVHAVGDSAGLAAKLRQVLGSDALAQELRRGAKARVAAITDVAKLTQKKVGLFERMRERNQARIGELGASQGASFFPNDRERPALCGQGLIVVDLRGAEGFAAEKTLESIRDETLGSNWRVHVIRLLEEPWPVPATWTCGRYHEPSPWLGLEDEELVVYVRAGAFFDRGRFGELLELAATTRSGAGAFAWLRPAVLGDFPYLQDGGCETLLAASALIPAAFATRRAHLMGLDDLVGLETPAMTACAMLAVAATRAGLPFLHTGDLLGHDYAAPLEVSAQDQERALGTLEGLGLAAPHALAPWSRQLQTVVGESGAVTAGVGPDLLDELQALRKIRVEHERLKNHKLVRTLRGLGLFHVARAVLPGSKRYLGDGKKG